MFKNYVLPFLIFLVITFLAGFIGSFFTNKNIPGWYEFLKKPSFSPPNWVFAPVWSFLYFLMAISVFLIWKERKEFEIKNALIFYFIQLILNTLWSIIFFGFRKPFLAFLEIIVLWIFIILTIFEFYKIEKVASFLLTPYLLWISFALILNLFIWILNLKK